MIYPYILTYIHMCICTYVRTYIRMYTVQGSHNDVALFVLVKCVLL